MQSYCPSLTQYKRLKTLEVKIGDLLLGNFNPIRIQTMTTTNTNPFAVLKQGRSWYVLPHPAKMKQRTCSI